MAFLKGKYVQDSTLDGSKIKLKNGEALKGTKADGSEKEIVKVNGQDKVEFPEAPVVSQDPQTANELARKAYVDAQREAAKAHSDAQDALQTAAIASEAQARLAGDQALDSRVSLLEASTSDKDYVDQKVLEEKQLREAADTALDARLDVLEANPVTKTYVDAGDQGAKDYADQKIAALVNSAPATLDTLKELADAIAAGETVSQGLLTQIGAANARITTEVSDRQAGDAALSTRVQALESGQVTKSYVDAADSALSTRIQALETYSQSTVWVDQANGVDEAGRGSMLRPFKTINYAYSQVPSLGNQTNTSYNANVERFITEKLVIHLAPGRYVENVVLGFKRARVKLTGDGATIVGDVKMSVKLADFPAANLENLKSSFPAPFTGGSAFMNFELSGKSGGGLESDPTANVLVVTGQASIAFEEANVPGSGVIFPNWDGSFGQFYSYLDGVSLGNFVVTTSHNAAQPTLPAGVIEIESCNIAATASTYRMHTGIVPYSYLTDFATWSTATKGTTNKTPSGTWTLKAHNSTFGNVIGPRLTIGEMDGCRIYDIDRTMRGTVDNGAISGSTSTSYLGMINNQFRIYGGSGDLASAYKLGQASGATRYKIDSVSYTTLAFSRNSSGVLAARTLDVGAGVSYDFLDDARSIFVNDPATNYTRSANTVDAALEGLDAALALKANQSSVAPLETAVASLQSSLAGLQATDTSLQSQINTEKGRIDAEIAARQSGDSTLQTAINSEIAARQSGDTTLQASIDTQKARVDVLRSDVDGLALSKADKSALDAEKARIDAILAASDADKDSFAEIVQLINSVDTANDQAFAAYVLSNNAALASEATARADADALLDGRLDALEQDPTTKDYVDNKFNAAKFAWEQADLAEANRAQGEEARIEGKLDQEVLDRTQQVSELASSIMQMVSTEVADRLAGDAGLQAQINVLTSDLAQEVTARANMDSALQSLINDLGVRVDEVDAKPILRCQKQSFTMSAQDIANGYVDCDCLAAPMSMVLYVGGIVHFEEEDYMLSEVGGKTRITFMGDLVVPSDGALLEGDIVRIQYMTSQPAGGGGGGGGGELLTPVASYGFNQPLSSPGDTFQNILIGPGPLYPESSTVAVYRAADNAPVTWLALIPQPDGTALLPVLRQQFSDQIGQVMNDYGNGEGPQPYVNVRIEITNTGGTATVYADVKVTTPTASIASPTWEVDSNGSVVLSTVMFSNDPGARWRLMTETPLDSGSYIPRTKGTVMVVSGQPIAVGQIPYGADSRYKFQVIGSNQSVLAEQDIFVPFAIS